MVTKEAVDRIKKLLALSESNHVGEAAAAAKAADLLGVVPSTLEEYIHSGQLRIFHLGRRVLIRLEALNAFAQGLEDTEAIVKAAARND